MNQAIGVFDVPEMNTMRLWGGCHGDGSVAIVYDYAGVPPWFDLVRFHADSADAVSSTPHHDPRHVPPGSTVVAVVYVPVLQQAFSTVSLDAQDWLICTLVASSVLWLGELAKLIRRGRMGHAPGSAARTA